MGCMDWKKGAASFEIRLNPCWKRVGKSCILPRNEAGGACSDLRGALTCWAGLLLPVPPGFPFPFPLCSQCPDLLTTVMGLCGNFEGVNICLSARLGRSVISHVPFGNDISKQNLNFPSRLFGVFLLFISWKMIEFGGFPCCYANGRVAHVPMLGVRGFGVPLPTWLIQELG